MTETEFMSMADQFLADLEDQLMEAADEGQLAGEVDRQPGGVLNIELDNGEVLVINRHLAAQEIWLASRQGGQHFRFSNGAWVDTRSGADLLRELERAVAAQGGGVLELAMS